MAANKKAWLEQRFFETYNRHKDRVNTYPNRLAAYHAANVPPPKSESDLRIYHYLIKNHIRQHAALLAAKPPILTIPVPEGTNKEDIARVEDYLWACYDKLGVNEIIFDAIFHSLVFGEAYLWGPLKTAARLGYNNFPLILFVESPEFVFAEFDPSRQFISYAFRRKRRLLDDVYAEVEAIVNQYGEFIWRLAPLKKLKKTAGKDGNDVWVWYTEYYGPDESGQLIHCVGIDETTRPAGPENYQRGDIGNGTGGAISFGEYIKPPTPWPELIPIIPVILSPTPQEDPAFRADSLAADLDTQQKTLCMLASIAASSIAIRPNAPTVGYGLMRPDTPPDLARGAYNPLTDPQGFIRPIEGMMPRFDEISALHSMISANIAETSLPGSMFGQFQANISGIALSTLNQPAFFRTARMQRRLEWVYRQLNHALLSLFSHVRNNLSSMVSPNPRYSEPRILNLQDVVVPPNLETVVKLSTATNQDVAMMTQVIMLLVKERVISLREAREMLQNIVDTPTKNTEAMAKEIIQEQAQQLVLSDPNFLRAIVQEELTRVGIKTTGEGQNPQLQGMMGAAAQEQPVPGVHSSILSPQIQPAGKHPVELNTFPVRIDEMREEVEGGQPIG